VSEVVEVDICVIGAGSGGLSVAAGASQLGRSTVLIERHRMGGDCLNTGCVPSKALLAAAKTATAARHAGGFGIGMVAPVVDFAAVRRHVRGVIEAIAPNDSVERFTALGVRVIAGEARFTGHDRVSVGETTIRARRFVVATGSRPAVPPIPGLDQVAYLTNETVFDNPVLPDHLIVIGGGPIGVELAQAHRRLGSRVSIVEAATLLGQDDPELVDVLRRELRRDEVTLYENAAVQRVAPNGERITVTLSRGGDSVVLDASHLLIASGRRPTIEALDLAAAGIEHGPAGIMVDRRLLTTNRRVFAIGDVADGPRFTHVAGYHAGIVIRNALFRLPAKTDYTALPHVTYTDPELAQVGLTEAEARVKHGVVTVLRWPVHENDRAQAERRTPGFVKVVTTPRGRILGAGIIGADAGDLLQVWTLAIGQGLKIGAVANMIAPYPTLGEASKRAAGSFFMPKLFSDRSRRLVGWLARLG